MQLCMRSRQIQWQAAREYIYKLYKKLYETMRDKSAIHNIPNNAMIGNFQSC
jgi:hypothetical protein